MSRDRRVERTASEMRDERVADLKALRKALEGPISSRAHELYAEEIAALEVALAADVR